MIGDAEVSSEMGESVIAIGVDGEGLEKSGMGIVELVKLVENDA